MLATSCHRMELPAYYIDGMFFRKGKDVSVMSMVQSHMMSSIMDLEGNKCWNLTLDKGATVPEEVLAYRIPDKRVKNREDFLNNVEVHDKISKIQVSNSLDIDRSRTLKIGEVLPGNFMLRDLEETEWNKERLKNRITVINLWFSSCGPCLKEFPILSKWKEEYPDVNFLSANPEKKDVVKHVVEARKFTWTHLYADDYFCKYLDGEGFPMFLVLDGKGELRLIRNGATNETREAVLKCIQTLRDEAKE